MDLTIVHSDYCPHCKQLIEDLQKQDGKITGVDNINLINIDNDDSGIELLQKVEANDIPKAIKNDEIVCEIEYINGRIEVLCPEN